MSKIANKNKVVYKPSTKDYLTSLVAMPGWSKILLDNVSKPYNEFLEFLLHKKYYEGRSEAITIKGISNEYGRDQNRVSKWFSDIYSDIIRLNEDKPELFEGRGLRHDITYKNYDDYGGVTVWLEHTPQTHDWFNFTFAKACVGTSAFYIEHVEHQLEDCMQIIHLRLQGGYVNKYRELLLERALYYKRITWKDLIEKYPYQIDEELKSHYRY